MTLLTCSDVIISMSPVTPLGETNYIALYCKIFVSSSFNGFKGCILTALNVSEYYSKKTQTGQSFYKKLTKFL